MRWVVPSRLLATMFGLVVSIVPSPRIEAYLPPAYGGSIVAALPDAPLTLDPALATRESELQIVSLLYDTLFRVGENDKPRPHLLAGEPQISADGKLWTMQLRPGVTLHDGSELVAADIVHALQHVRQGPHRYLLADIASIGAPDPHKILIQLDRPDPQLALRLSAPATSIAARRQGQNVGSGAFRLMTWAPKRIQLVAHTKCFAGRPYVNRLEFVLFEGSSTAAAAFQAGAVQVSFQAAGIPGGAAPPVHLRATTEPVTTVVLGFGDRSELTRDRVFRRAVAMAIDRRRLARLTGPGRDLPAGGWISPRLLSYREPMLRFDRVIARRLSRIARSRQAATSGVAGGGNRLSLLVDGSRADDRIAANQIVADLDRIGFVVTIDARPAADYVRGKTQGSYDLVLDRIVPQLANAAIAVAGALAEVGRGDQAVRCMQTACGAEEAREVSHGFAIVPLVHAGEAIYLDARIGGLALSREGRVAYADLYWGRSR